MAAFEVIALDTATPQLRAPGAADTYTFPRAVAMTGALTYGGVTLNNAVTGTGNMVLSTSPTFTTPVLGTPSSGTLTSCTGLPISTGVAGLGIGVVTALTTNTGSVGAVVVNGGALGTPSSGTLTNATGLPLSTGVTGTLPVANGGTGQTSYTNGQLLIGNSTGNTLSKATLTAGSNVTITNGPGSITIAASGGGGGGSSTLTIQDKTAAYTVVAGDVGTIINCTANTFTVSLTAAATLGAGFNCWIWNTGPGVITIVPNGTEAVDGIDPTTEFKITQGTGVRLVCTGTAWLTGDNRTAGTPSIGVLGTQIGRNSLGNMSIATSGQGAVALGGSYASGTDSFAAGNGNNTTSYGSQATYAICLGGNARASGSSSAVLGGAFNLASGVGSVSIGGNGGATASGACAVAIGGGATSNGAIAAAQNSFALGDSSHTPTVKGKFAFSSDGAPVQGGAQYGNVVLRRDTTSATAATLGSDGAAGASNNQIILPNSSAQAFSGIIVARRQAASGTQSAAWKIEGLIRRESTAATTVLVNSALTVLSNVPGWGVSLSGDTINGGLAITVTGAAATNIRWVATVQTAEVIYA